MNTEPRKALQMFLMCSFAYYHLGRSLIPDEKFDKICVFLLKNWDNFEHQHKYLISKEDLEAGTAFTLKWNDYPMVVKQATMMRINEIENDVTPNGVR